MTSKSHETSALKRALVKSEDGHEFLEQGNMSQAQMFLKQSTRIQEEELVKKYDTLASLSIQQGNYSDALQEYRKSLTLLQQQQHSQRLVAKCLTNIGNVMEQIQDWQGAIQHYRQALDVYQGLNPSIFKQVADLHSTIARILLTKTNDEEGARHELNLAHQVRQALESNKVEAISLLDDGSETETATPGSVSLEPDDTQESPRLTKSENQNSLDQDRLNGVTGQETNSYNHITETTRPGRVSLEPDDSQESPRLTESENQNSLDQDRLNGVTGQESNSTNHVTLAEAELLEMSESDGTAGTSRVAGIENIMHTESEKPDAVSHQGRSDVATPYTPALQESNLFEDALTAANKGTELLEEDNLQGALVQFQEALRVYNQSSEQPDLSAVATTHSNIGLVLSKQGHHEDALIEYRRALCIREEDSPDSLLVASCCKEIAVLLDTMQEYSHSLHYYERAIFISQRLGNADMDLAMLHFEAGAIHEKQGDAHAALCEYRMASEIVENLDQSSYSLDLADIYMAIGDLLVEQGDAKAPIEAYEKVLGIHEQNGLSSSVQEIRDRIQELSGDTTVEEPTKLDVTKTGPDFENVTASLDWEQGDASDGEEMPTDSSGTKSENKRSRARDNPKDNGTTGQSLGKRARLLTDRFSIDCSTRAPAKKWTEKEQRLLQEKRSAGMSYGQISELLSGRTEDAVAKRCRTLGIKVMSNVTRTDGDPGLSQTKARASAFSNPVAATMPRRSFSRPLKKRKKKKTDWTDEEDCILRRGLARGLSWNEIAEMLPKRNGNACERRYARFPHQQETSRTVVQPNTRTKAKSSQNKKRIEKADRFSREDIRLVRQSRLTSLSRL